MLKKITITSLLVLSVIQHSAQASEPQIMTGSQFSLKDKPLFKGITGITISSSLPNQSVIAFLPYLTLSCSGADREVLDLIKVEKRGAELFISSGSFTILENNFILINDTGSFENSANGNLVNLTPKLYDISNLSIRIMVPRFMRIPHVKDRLPPGLRLLSTLRFDTTSNITVYMEMQGLKFLENKGTGDIKVERIRSQSLVVENSGNGDINFKNVECVGSVTLKNYGNGNIALWNGKFEQLNVTNTGSGEMSIGALISGSLTYNMTGDGTVKINSPEGNDDYNVYRVKGPNQPTIRK